MVPAFDIAMEFALNERSRLSIYDPHININNYNYITQVAGHLFEEGKAGSLIDDRGHFYKPIQPGPRGDREKAFYELIRAKKAADKEAWTKGLWSPSATAAMHAILSSHRVAPSPTSSAKKSQIYSLQATSSAPSSPARPTTTPHNTTNGHTTTSPMPVPSTPNTSRPYLSFPTFRTDPSSFKESDLANLHRDPITVLERDELGLIDQVVEEELLQWSDEDEEGISIKGTNHDHHHNNSNNNTRVDFTPDLHLGVYSRSPDSDDGHELTTGESVMEGITKAFSARQSQLHNTSITMASTTTTTASFVSGLSNGGSSENGGIDAKASSSGTVSAAETGSAHGHTSTSFTFSDTDGDSFTTAGVVVRGGTLMMGNQQEQQQPLNAAPYSYGNTADDNVYQAWYTQQRRGLLHCSLKKASNASTDSIEEALRVHALSLKNAISPPQPLNECENAVQLLSIDDVTIDVSERRTSAMRNEGRDLGRSNALLPVLSEDEKEGGVGGNSPPYGTAAVYLPSPFTPSPAKTPSLPFSVRNAPLLRVIPKFYGVRKGDDRILLELEDLARWYHHPCIMDVKIGHRTWYDHADPAYIERCRKKDAATTQSLLGFKICGMQVYRHTRGGYWRASKRWCKTLPEVIVDKALISFAHNEHGLRPSDVYGGSSGAIAQLESLLSWFESQTDFHFYSASVLILYEGDAQGADDANVRVRLVDFAHTFSTDRESGDEYVVSGKDENFTNGLKSLVQRFVAVNRYDVADTLM